LRPDKALSKARTPEIFGASTFSQSSRGRKRDQSAAGDPGRVYDPVDPAKSCQRGRDRQARAALFTDVGSDGQNLGALFFSRWTACNLARRSGFVASSSKSCGQVARGGSAFRPTKASRARI